jgi:hypothetical protein
MEQLFHRAENAGPLGYLAHGRSPADAFFGPPPADVDRRHLGANPSIVDRLWDELNAALPDDARWLVFDGPALVHPKSGVILGVVIGTQYALRLLPHDLALALAAGSETVHSFSSVGTTLDLQSSFGADWAFGRLDEREPAWLRATYLASGR